MINEWIARWHEWHYRRLMRKFDRMIAREVACLQDFEHRVFGPPDA